ncbi:MAG: MATE family efflux transporter [Clostridia bacterium]|nr:MATE family efflux transporter [Clostridia bacterium]
MYASEIKDFTKGNITKQLIVFALPLFLSNLLQVVYNMVDMIVVGNVLGKAGISAVSVGGDVSNLMVFIAMGFASAGQVIIARYVGSGERKKIGRFVGTMSGFLMACAIIISVLGLVFQDGLLTLMNTPKEAYDGAKSYSMICMFGLVFIYGYNFLSAVLRGMGDSKHPFVFISIAALLNLVLDLWFVIGLKMGAGGAALATVISQGASFLSCAIFLVIKRKSFELEMKLKDFFVWNKNMLVDLIKLGTPMAIKFAAVQVSKLFVNGWVNGYGVAVSAFSGISHKLTSIAILISNSMNTAGSTIVGQNLVAGEFDRVKKTLKNLAVITLTASAIMSLIIAIFPEAVFSLFTDKGDTDVLALARPYVPIAVLNFLASALRAMMNALINGSGNYKINFATAILDGIVLRIGLALLFGLAFNMQHFGFWLGDALAGFTPFWIGLIFYFSGKWKNSAKKKTEE